MATELNQVNKQYDSEIAKAQQQLQSLVKSKEWETAKAAVDAAGIVDPTPISDGIGTIMSLAEGDFIGAGLSAISLIPYLGDAVGKTAKGARALKRLKELADATAKVTKRLDQLSDKLARRREAARRVREAKRESVGSVEECAAKGKWGDDVQLPTTGSWKPPNSKGHGTWTSEDGKYTVEYEKGYPDFTRATGPAGTPIVKGKVEIEMDMGGKTSKDFSEADKAMRDVHGKDWKRSPGYTWHHSENGTSMVLVRKDVHDKSITRGGSGAAHSGGASIAKSPEF
ncbi:hypothetical protein BO221_05060 [Archangium sp. Cb G35]|uniref:HNH endonuclease n=1 Tax=Archangium sp. Cb G35 TaxID=1920190 RepID=UPI0009379356|nr:HNH endonuclease [Archangium sp. Cb G35]OJT27351.1 hypothetical protein BO221_05060 [Archangium sp. Cb G35]